MNNCELKGFDSIRPERSNWKQQEKPMSEKEQADRRRVNMNIVKDLEAAYQHFEDRYETETARYLIIAYATIVSGWGCLPSAFVPNLGSCDKK